MAEKDLTVTKTVTIENVGEEVTAFRYFRVNFAEKLEAGDKVVLTAGSSEEAAYYLALADEKVGLKVTVA
jgi:hypothetical protein